MAISACDECHKFQHCPPVRPKPKSKHSLDHRLHRWKGMESQRFKKQHSTEAHMECWQAQGPRGRTPSSSIHASSPEREPLSEGNSRGGGDRGIERVQDLDVHKGVQSALRALKWYQGQVSPFLPKSCRFLPTCSEYSMQAYREYGNVKGTVLTAWRLLRCNPLNFNIKYQGKYDPPQWPPVGFQWLLK